MCGMQWISDGQPNLERRESGRESLSTTRTVVYPKSRRTAYEVKTNKAEERAELERRQGGATQAGRQRGRAQAGWAATGPGSCERGRVAGELGGELLGGGLRGELPATGCVRCGLHA